MPVDLYPLLMANLAGNLTGTFHCLLDVAKSGCNIWIVNCENAIKT